MTLRSVLGIMGVLSAPRSRSVGNDMLASRRLILSSLCGAMILPVMLLISVAVWPPSPRTEWKITLILAIIWGSITAALGAAVVWVRLRKTSQVDKGSPQAQ